MKTIRRIPLSTVCPGPRVSRDDAAPLRSAIEAAFRDGEIAEVDLEGTRIASLSFLDEGIVSFLIDHSVEFVAENLRLANVDRLVRDTLNRVARTRVKTIAAGQSLF